MRAITIEAGLAEGVTLGTALDGMEAIARDVLPPEAPAIQGPVLELRNCRQLDPVRVCRRPADRFPGAGGAVRELDTPAHHHACRFPPPCWADLSGIWLTGNTLNIYTQIGLIMLVGLAAKNGILVVEFANQLRDAGKGFRAALKQAAMTRLRPIVMTGLTTAAGAVPLVISHGAGAETRAAIGIVVLFGIAAAVIVSLIVVPAAYALLARGTGSPGDVARQLEDEALTMPDPKETYADELPARAAE